MLPTMADPERKPELNTGIFEVQPPTDIEDFYEKVRDFAYKNTQREDTLLSNTRIGGPLFDYEKTILCAWRQKYFDKLTTEYLIGTTLYNQTSLPDSLAFYSFNDVEKINTTLKKTGLLTFVRPGSYQELVAVNSTALDYEKNRCSDFAIRVRFGYPNRSAVEASIRNRLTGKQDLSKRELEAEFERESSLISAENIEFSTSSLYNGNDWNLVVLNEDTFLKNIDFYTQVYTSVARAIHELRGQNSPNTKVVFNFQPKQTLEDPKSKPDIFETVTTANVPHFEEEKVHNSVGTPEIKTNKLLPTTTWEGFDAVAGQDSAVAEARKLVQAIKNPEIYQKRGVKIPKGILLSGPPGTGKTLLAKAIAKESGAKFMEVSGADINGKWFGESEQRMQALFDQARSGGRTILFFDEFDSLASPRDVAWEGSIKVLAVFNQNMDGVRSNPNVTVIAATNRPEGIDLAAKRSGRFDKIIEMGLPDEKGRLAIFKKHMEKAISASSEPEGLFSPGLDFDTIGRETNGFSGADLANLVNRVLEDKLSVELEGKVWTPVSTDEILDMAYKISIERTEKVAVDFTKK